MEPKANKLPIQFSLFELFVVMTAAAIGFAVSGLPIPLVAKIGPIWAVLLCWIGWAVRNRKYPDPRAPKVE